MRTLLDLLLRVARCTSGTAAVEAAIIMPILIALMTLSVTSAAHGHKLTQKISLCLETRRAPPLR
jgi:hypothetical protein